MMLKFLLLCFLVAFLVFWILGAGFSGIRGGKRSSVSREGGRYE